jgi:enoyl-[acyl-carrier protein] reductase II
MRVVKNRWVEDWERRPDEIQRFPDQMMHSAREGVLLFATGESDTFDTTQACMPCGQGAGGIDDIPTCAEIVDRVMRDARATIERLSAL